MKAKCVEFLEGLKMTAEERHQLERDTLEQSESGFWLEKRRKLITASNAGKICRRRATTSCKCLVAELLYKESGGGNAKGLRYGRSNEPEAIAEVERWLNREMATSSQIKIERCGLFVDEELPYLGATPDGLIGIDGIVEVKCPQLCENLTPEEAISQRIKSDAIKFWKQQKTGE